MGADSGPGDASGTVTYEFTRRELQELIRYSWLGPQRGSILRSSVLFMVSFGVLGVVPLRSVSGAGDPLVQLGQSFVAAAVLLALLMGGFLWLFLRQNEAAPGRMGTHTLSIGPDGIVLRDGAGTSARKWSVVREVGGTPSHLIFYVRAGRGEAVPKSAFASEEEAKAFRQDAVGWLAARGSG